MSLTKWALLFVPVMLAGVLPVCVFAADSPFDVADKTQLFVDKLLVHETNNVAFTLHPARKHPENPLVTADQPSDGWRVDIYGNVIYDLQDKIFKMWYLGEERRAFPHYGIRYAISKDGIHWEKPSVGTVHSKVYEKHNVVDEQALNASVIKDDADPDPSRRYKMICFLLKDYGYHTMVSPDGLHWKRFSQRPICPGADVITGYYDQRLKLYAAFAKISSPVRGYVRRVFWLVTSKDFQTWTEPKLVFKPDLRDDTSSLSRIEKVRPLLDTPDDPNVMRTEFYGVGVYPAESCTLAFVWVFTVNSNGQFNNQEGPCELQLAVSRDLERWERPFRVPCVPMGKIGQWDCGFLCTQSQALRVGDEVWLYYSAANYTHSNPVVYYEKDPKTGKPIGRKTKYNDSIGLAIWPLDRFVSVDGPAEGGTITTIPIKFTGKFLVINAAAKPAGSIIVDICDAAGKPLEDFTLSDPFTGDNLRHTVTFAGKSDLSSLVNKPISLRFHLKNAQLYSFAFLPYNPKMQAYP